MLTSIETSTCSMPAPTVILNTASGNSIVCCPALLQSWQRHMCLDYKIPSVEDGNGNLLQILLADILRLRFASAFYKTTFLVSDYFSEEVLNVTVFWNRYVNSIRCIYSQV